MLGAGNARLRPKRNALLHNPLLDPVYGDVVQGLDGERRYVEIRERDHRDRVHYRRAGENVSPSESHVLIDCHISEWLRWAEGADVLHTAYKPIDMITRKRRRRKRAQQH